MTLKYRITDSVKRHQERHQALGFNHVLADSIRFINQDDWMRVAKNGSLFLSVNYLATIEKYSPKNTQQRYAIAYLENEPVVVISCQIAALNGLNFIQPRDDIQDKVVGALKKRVLICGNLVSSGLDGVAFADSVTLDTGWRMVTELIYRIRKAERFSDEIDFAMVKDIKGEDLEKSKVIERYSYRKIQTDPDMVLSLDDSVRTFDDYLACLTTKYRSRIKKTAKLIADQGFECRRVEVTPALDKALYPLYLNVENKSSVRLATVAPGYFSGLDKSLGEQFCCYTIEKAGKIAGFISIVIDKGKAIAYYVGVDYKVNDKHPIYFRLLQLVIECAIEKGCREISFGRTALEPKASLGAKPVATYVRARHRVPVINYMIRKLFRAIPSEVAPVRKAIKGKS